MSITGRRLSFIVLVIAFALGSITILQLLPTMDEIEYSQEGYFNISKSDRARSIWNEEPVVFYKGRPSHRVRSENPNNVTLQELLAWEQVLGDDYQSYLKEMGLQYSILSVSPFNGTVVYYMCDLTEEKVKLFVDTMKYYVPMGVIVLSNACIVGYGLPHVSETQFNVVIELNKYVFGSKFTAKLIIKNEDSHEITYGRPYFIEKLVEGGWVEVSSIPPNWAWTDERLIIPAGRTTTQVIKVDTLEHGHYRVNKTINHERTQTELAFTLEFDIVGLTTYDNVTLEDEEQLIEIIKVAYDLREFLNSGRLQHVAASPSERDIVNATILLGEIVEGKNAEMIMGYEVDDSMTTYVRYFTVKRYNLRGSPSHLIGERHGWIDQLGRCHVYDGWAELSST